MVIAAISVEKFTSEIWNLSSKRHHFYINFLQFSTSTIGMLVRLPGLNYENHCLIPDCFVCINSWRILNSFQFKYHWIKLLLLIYQLEDGQHGNDEIIVLVLISQLIHQLINLYHDCVWYIKNKQIKKSGVRVSRDFWGSRPIAFATHIFY